MTIEMKRNQLLDITKGILIVFVILGHSLSVVPNWEQNAIALRIVNTVSSFHMPMFFVLAGYLMYSTLKGSRSLWIWNKALYLLIPHLAFSSAY